MSMKRGGTAARHGLVLGCGSNVVDLFFKVRSFPKPGDKQYFSGVNPLAATVVGGVTLNHLMWAAALGAPTGLLALQGDDEVRLPLRSARHVCVRECVPARVCIRARACILVCVRVCMCACVL
jgi:hypothetical protein